VIFAVLDLRVVDVVLTMDCRPELLGFTFIIIVILRDFGVIHECDGQTDGQTFW